MPFDVDVTTEEPATFTGNVARIVITHSRQASGVCMPECDAGGGAFLGIYGWADYHAIGPALVYFDNLSSDAQIVAEATSHEAGHNFGLGHHGTATPEYFSGDRQVSPTVKLAGGPSWAVGMACADAVEPRRLSVHSQCRTG